MHVNELENCLKVSGLKISGNKNKLVARLFCTMENKVMPVNTSVEVEEDLKKEYEKKLWVDDRLIPVPFKIPHGWLEEVERMAFWPMLLYPNIFNYLMFYPTKLGSTVLSGYKNSKVYSCYKSGWFQSLCFHTLYGCKYCILKAECRQSQRVNEINHKYWIVMEKFAKIRSCHCTCMAGMGQSCNHVAAAMYRIEKVVKMGWQILLVPAQRISSFQSTGTFNSWKWSKDLSVREEKITTCVSTKEEI